MGGTQKVNSGLIIQAEGILFYILHPRVRASMSSEPSITYRPQERENLY